MMTCSEAVQRLWAYLEDEVSPQERVQVEDHLAFCRRCCGEVAFAEELRNVLAAAREVDLPAGVEARLTSVLDDLDPSADDRRAGDGGASVDDPAGAPDG